MPPMKGRELVSVLVLFNISHDCGGESVVGSVMRSADGFKLSGIVNSRKKRNDTRGAGKVRNMDRKSSDSAWNNTSQSDIWGQIRRNTDLL